VRYQEARYYDKSPMASFLLQFAEDRLWPGTLSCDLLVESWQKYRCSGMKTGITAVTNYLDLNSRLSRKRERKVPFCVQGGKEKGRLC